MFRVEGLGVQGDHPPEKLKVLKGTQSQIARDFNASSEELHFAKTESVHEVLQVCLKESHATTQHLHWD